MDHSKPKNKTQQKRDEKAENLIKKTEARDDKRNIMIQEKCGFCL